MNSADILFLLTSSAFFIWIFRDLLFWLWMWQHHEYRIDRLFATIRAKRSKVLILFPYLSLVGIVLLLLYSAVIIDDSLLDVYHASTFTLFSFQFLLIGIEFYKDRLKKPKPTIKVILIFGVSLLTLLLFFMLQLMDRFFWLLLVDLFVPIIVGIYVLIFSLQTELFGDWQTDRALKKLHYNPDLMVIAVTGSYGKSIVKDIIAHVLSTKYKVIKTHGTDNTMLGIANTIVKHLESDTEIFVVEMSAYKRGEITAMCQFVHPTIGVLTGINGHYKNLFKTQENINNTNYELVESVSKKGYCLFNGNNKYTEELYKKSKKQKMLYTTEESKHFVASPDMKAFQIIQRGKKIIFNVQFRNISFKHLSIDSGINPEYTLPAISIAHRLGMTEGEVKKALLDIKSHYSLAFAPAE